jgi:cupin superfamily acireductone dioxygenase involved in methionine salvage
MRILRQQRGLTLIGGILILVVIGFVAYVAMQLVPVYLEYFNVISSVKTLREDPDLHAKSEHEIRELLKKRFFVNDVKHVKARNPKQISIRKTNTSTIVTVDYEVRVGIIGNLDAIATFHREDELK